MTTKVEEQNKEKIINLNLMTKLAICNMCYIEEYTCAFREYYYKGTYSIDESKEIRKLYFTKLPEPLNRIPHQKMVSEQWMKRNIRRNVLVEN